MSNEVFLVLYTILVTIHCFIIYKNSKAEKQIIRDLLKIEKIQDQLRSNLMSLTETVLSGDATRAEKDAGSAKHEKR